MYLVYILRIFGFGQNKFLIGCGNLIWKFGEICWKLKSNFNFVFLFLRVDPSVGRWHMTHLTSVYYTFGNLLFQYFKRMDIVSVVVHFRKNLNSTESDNSSNSNNSLVWWRHRCESCKQADNEAIINGDNKTGREKREINIIHNTWFRFIIFWTCGYPTLIQNVFTYF